MILTLVVFAVAVVLWTCTPLDDTFVALAAVVALLLSGVLPASALAVLGGSTTWLLIAAFVLAAGVSASGLPARLASSLVGRARSVRGLMHLTAFALLLTAFFVPSTSGRAALALPVHRALRVNARVSRALGVLFPSVILLTAVATLVGAGAHLITSALLEQATGQGIGFGQWMLLGLPLAVVSAHVTAEVVLWLFTTRADRAEALAGRVEPLAGRVEPLDVSDEPTVRFAARSEGPLPGDPCSNSPRQHRQFSALTRPEITSLAIVGVVSVGWLTESWHHVPPEVTALAGAVAITAPRLGTTTLKAAFADIPWSLLLFMAATTMLGSALVSSGAAHTVATLISPSHLLPTVIAVSLLAHLLIQSRSARSSVLVPIVIPLAAAAGMNPAALAFASTAAAGFCHTTTASAKPVALFAGAYRPRDLLKLAAVLAPITGALVLACAVLLWPHLGLPLK
ncbi:SLC13 family permease [Lentzea flaviverrucosa]|uniref:Di-and tricarboxylate transporter n=1 Tax=Lentzea flaviverrucosa TaxID=200379 RepID=A0A1H9XEP2_9PSEU|nr:SLC13 family permease [Lentzea flaviverrucosa]RDI21565.1 di/tricarboxylate transporter [Lentzea flaviverrucosa]SES44133.1 Di-and tricarboxylate transporter [Lentzea flaviverrucosa]